MKIELIQRILHKGYYMSVDNGHKLLVHCSRDIKAIQTAMNGLSDLLWIRDQHQDKMGWMKVNSKTGLVLDYSARDKRMCDLVADEFIGKRRRA